MELSLTRFLSVNIALLVLFPWAQSVLAGPPLERKAFGITLVKVFIFLAIVFSALYGSFWPQAFKRFEWRYLPLAAAASFLALGCEFAVTRLLFGKIVFMKITRNNRILTGFLLLGIPLIEEVIFRGFLFYLITQLYGLPVWAFLAASTLAFALDHLVYPKINVLTKAFWGFFFAALFLMTENLLYPILAHWLNNFIILALEKRQGVKTYA